MSMRLLITIIFLSCSGVIFGQNVFRPAKIRTSVLALTKQIPDYIDSLETEYLQITYDTVFRNATTMERYELTNHPNPLVRRSALHYLKEEHSPWVVKLLAKSTGDTFQYFQIQYGCLVESETFLDQVLFYLSPRSGWDRYFALTPAQKATVEKLLNEREAVRK